MEWIVGCKGGGVQKSKWTAGVGYCRKFLAKTNANLNL